MWSLWRRASESRAPARTVSRVRWGRCWFGPIFVPITTASRLERDASQLPMIVSDSPPELPGTHAE